MKEKIQKEFEFYHRHFITKMFKEDNNDTDVLMDIFCLSQSIKNKNKQYWGRELGKLWEKIINIVFKETVPTLYKPATKINKSEPYDLLIGNFAIDTKYRLGSGDSGTLKKFTQYGQLITSMGYEPIILLLRNDNLPQAIHACKKGNWTIYTGDQSFDFVKSISNFNLKNFLTEYSGKYSIY